MTQMNVHELLVVLNRIAASMERAEEVQKENLILNRAFLSERRDDRSLADLMASEHLRSRLLNLRRRPEGGFKTEPMTETEVAEIAAHDASLKNMYEELLWRERRILDKKLLESKRGDE